jgi:hypothetical protein
MEKWSVANGPQLSAILATPDQFDSIRRTVRYLSAQTVSHLIELVLVCPSEAGLRLDEAAVQGFWGHRVIEIPPFRSVAVPNAAGVRAATAHVVVFCEDHSFPDRHWAERLIMSHRGPYAVVGPSVHNANPDTLVSRADFLIGYGPWAEPIDACEPEHLPGHNSAYKRDILLGYGSRLEELLEAESILHWDLRKHGHRLYLESSARVAHTNFARFGIWSGEQFHAGRVFAGTRAGDWPLVRRIFYGCASPLIPFVRFKRIWDDARRVAGAHRMRPALGLVLMSGLVFNGLGQMLGHLAGVGRSRAMAHEFCRVRFITEQDRRLLTQREPGAQSVAKSDP